MKTKMTPTEAWQFAASWGATGSPAACLYNFNEACKPFDEIHRQDVLRQMEFARVMVSEFPDEYEPDELEKIDAFLEFITNRECVQS